MKKSNFLKWTLAATLALSLNACKKETIEDNQPIQASAGKGFFIVNEGQYGKGNASLSFYNRDSKLVSNDVFAAANSRPLGDVAQSMTIINNKAYMVVNVSNKIEIIDTNSFKSTAVIPNLNGPRYMVAFGNKAYVTEWAGYVTPGTVAVINLSTNTVEKRITVGNAPEHLLVVNNKLYVANYNDSTVSVINTSTDVVEKTIPVRFGARDLAVDANNNIWVLCAGKYNSAFTQLDINGGFQVINPATNLVTKTIVFNSIYSSPEKLAINSTKDKLYYSYNGGICQLSINQTGSSETPVINRYAYGFAIDPVNGNLIVGDAGNFTSNGSVFRYTSSFAVIDSFKVGIAPNGFCFK